MLWPCGEAGALAQALAGVRSGGRVSSRRKVLCVAADGDSLVPPTIVAENADAYAGV